MVRTARPWECMVNVMNREPEDDVHRAGMAAVLQKFGNLFRKQSIYLPAEWSVSESVRLFRLVLNHNPSDPRRRIELATRAEPESKPQR